MASEWVVLNSIAERDDDANLLYPWYPGIFADNGSLSASLNIWFATEDECRDFIKDHILGATLEER